MSRVIKILRSNVKGRRPTGRAAGEIYANWADKQFGVVDDTGAAQDLVGITFHSTLAEYVTGQPVVQNNKVYLATKTIAPGPFVVADWDLLGKVDLAAVPSDTDVLITNTGGQDVRIPAAGSKAGVMSKAQLQQINAYETRITELEANVIKPPILITASSAPSSEAVELFGLCLHTRVSGGDGAWQEVTAINGNGVIEIISLFAITVGATARMRVTIDDIVVWTSNDIWAKRATDKAFVPDPVNQACAPIGINNWGTKFNKNFKVDILETYGTVWRPGTIMNPTGSWVTVKGNLRLGIKYQLFT